MNTPLLTLRLLNIRLAVCRLPADAPQPSWAGEGLLSSLTRTPYELSVVCEERLVPPGVRCEAGWGCFMVRGPLDFSLTGVVASLALPLARAGIPLFALSTFDTDYLLVRARDVARAAAVLVSAGHRLEEKETSGV